MTEHQKTMLIDRAIAVLLAVGLKVLEVRGSGHADATDVDAVLRIGRSKGGEDYLVGTRRSVTPQAIGGVVARLRRLGKAACQPTLLVADYLTPRVVVHLRAIGQSFVDAAGNVYLEAPGVLICVMGCRPRQPPSASRPTKASTRNGLKILLALGRQALPADEVEPARPERKRITRSAVPGLLAELQSGSGRHR